MIYLCPVDILGSTVLFTVLMTLKNYFMARFGIPDFDLHPTSGGNMFTEQSIVPKLESHGAMIFFFFWSLWIARDHFKTIWRQIRFGDGEQSDARAYRVASLAMVLSGAYGLWPWQASRSPP